MRARHLIATATAATTILVSAGVARADDQRGTSRHRLHFASAPTAPTTIPASECTADGKICQFLFFGHEAFTGDIAGTETNAGAIAVDPTTFIGPAVSLATFTGTVHGCAGPGTAVISWTADLNVTPGHNTGAFEIVAGSATAGLHGLRGSGTVLATEQPDGTLTSVGTATSDCDD